MGKGLIKEDMFPEITDKYNREGRSAACAMLREEYGIRRPDKVIARIRKSAAYLNKTFQTLLLAFLS